MQVKVKKENEIGKTISKTLKLLEQISKSQTLSCYGKTTSDIFEGFSCSYPQSGLDGIIHGMIIDSCYQSERSGANSTKLCFDLINQFFHNEGYDKNLSSKVKKFCKGQNFGFEFNNLQESISRITESKMIGEMCLDAIRLAGVDGMIEPEYTSTGVYSVELMNGFSFPVKANEAIYDKGAFEWENVKLMAVDGTVDRESHVSGILTECSIENQPLIILARGFGEEALNTILGNVARGNIKCCPLLIPYELEKINYLSDICGLIGADTINSTKGNVISAAKLEELKSFDKVRFFKNKTVFFSPKANPKASIDAIVKKLDVERNDSVRDFLNERIRNLASRRVAIRIGSKSKSQAKFEISEVEKILRHAKDMKNSGEIQICRLASEFDELSFLEQEKTKLSCISVCSAVYHAQKCVEMLNSLGAAITNDTI